jgi:hypothetical protein
MLSFREVSLTNIQKEALTPWAETSITPGELTQNVVLVPFDRMEALES